MANVRIPSPPNVGASSGEMWRGGRPFLFCVTRPDRLEPLYDVALALHVNPAEVTERMTKVKTVRPSYGGYVEWLWPDSLDAVSANGSTGGFISPQLGYTAAQYGKGAGSRQQTMAYERFQDFLELFRMNGVIYDGRGEPALRGRVMMVYDRGVFYGHFNTFEVTEEDTKQFSFSLSWDFKVEHAVYRLNGSQRGL